MRKIRQLLVTLSTLLLLTGCTTFQAKEAGRGIAGGLFEMVLDIATDGPERRADERRRWEDNPANRWSACLPPCEITTDWQDRLAAAEREEEAQRKKDREAREYEDQVNSIIDSLEKAAELHSGDPPSSISIDQ